MDLSHPPHLSDCSSSTFASVKQEKRMALSPSHVQLNKKFSLTCRERQIFELLLKVASYFGLSIQFRVAGGWVRDKLLGKDCNDIDITLDNMTGIEFCAMINAYMSNVGEKTLGVAVIKSNPDQSKHLETARIRIFDIWLDFVNLRSENYSENTRIPTMKLGTPEEDAFRRDLTINSLFYNVNTGVVEDFTKRGYADLGNGVIATPLPAMVTFVDDPLRVLRAIRFGARFGFVLVAELIEAVASVDVREAFTKKIKRERIGHEIDLMLSDAQPVKAMTYICDLNLFGDVFSLPSNYEPATFEAFDRLCIACMEDAWNIMQLSEPHSFNEEERRLGLYAALFLPFRKTVYKDTKDKRVTIVEYLFRSSLKLKISDAQAVIHIHSVAEKFVSLISYILPDEDIEVAEIESEREFIDFPATFKPRLLAGLLLDEMKSFWRVALLVSTLLCPISIDCTGGFLDKDFEFKKRSELFRKVEDAISGLDKIWEVKPLVNGNAIMSVLKLKSGGPLVREWQHKVRQWQLLFHPFGTSEDCLDWFRKTKGD